MQAITAEAMASKPSASAALFLALNLLFFASASASGTYPSSSPSTGSCPIDALKLGVCADVLQALIVNIGKPPKEPCCTLLDGLVDLDAAVCVCTALKANILGINLNIPVDLSLLLNYCGKKAPECFQCA